ncbi:CoA-disulfide reductase [Erysipelotrichaceae bacterium]|nr:CoA-disulfide reductase [Erysipelotrichaceae bacterium]
MRIVIIGGIAAGMSTAAKARRVNVDAEIIVIEKENYISFGACGLPYYLGNQFTDAHNMFARTPEQIRNSGISLLLQHEVMDVNFFGKQLKVKNLATDDILDIMYDKLMIATGAMPTIPEIEGVRSANVYTFTRLASVEKLKENLDQYKNIAIIGGGFIGVEVAEQLAHLGKKVQIFHRGSEIMRNVFDREMTAEIENALVETGVKLMLNEQVTSLEVEGGLVKAIKTQSGIYTADCIIIAIGFKPNTAFLTDERLIKSANGAIIIDSYGATSIPDVFSAGDCATVPTIGLGNTYAPLATSANKIGRIIGTNIVCEPENYLKYPGSLRSSQIKIGKYEAGSTGMQESVAKKQGISCSSVFVTAKNHTNYYPGQVDLKIKLVYEQKTKVLLGAQVFGENGAVLRLSALSTAIYAGLTTAELGFIDFGYAPPFAQTWDALNIAANAAK